MLNRQMNLTELMSGMEAAFHDRGQSYYSQLFNLKCCHMIVNLHESRELEYLDREIVTEYIKELHNRFDNGSIGKGFYYGQLKNIRWMLEYEDTGKVSWCSPLQGSKYELIDEFNQIVDA